MADYIPLSQPGCSKQDWEVVDRSHGSGEGISLWAWALGAGGVCRSPLARGLHRPRCGRSGRPTCCEDCGGGISSPTRAEIE